MKNIVLLFFLFIFLGSGCADVKSIYTSDHVLEKLANNLPKNWSFSLNNENLILTRNEPVWIEFENRINAPVIINDATKKRTSPSGKETICKIVYHLEKKWSDEKLKQIEEEKNTLLKQINDLPKQFNITKLYDAFLSSKGRPTYVGRNQAEKKQVADYEKKKIELEDQIPVLPDFTTEKYSLFLESDNCAHDEFTTISPPEASEEIFQTREKIHELLKNS